MQSYIIKKNFEDQWARGQEVSERLQCATQSVTSISYLPVHGDSVLGQLDDHDLLCYFIYTLSSWWEMPVIDRINANKASNSFAIIMDINPAPETMYWLNNLKTSKPETRYKLGLKAMFPSIKDDAANAMYNLLRNGFGHNLFGREPGKIQFDDSFDCPPKLSKDNVLLVPPRELALSMVSAFLTKITALMLFPSDKMPAFKKYMTGKG